ncbi:Intradiol ring-cleavage dioxygenase [Xylariaceae sp. FL1019]|nr:Intradiol ring-cleavage dioxygenase [Xylariaceae sp. FL1019]
MVNKALLQAFLAVASLGSVQAHPGDLPEDVRRELAAHNARQPIARRAIQACAGTSNMAALKARTVSRRAATAQALREKRGLTDHRLKSKRDQDGFDKWAAVDHDSSSLGYDLDTGSDVIFSGNSTCALVPEVTIGPYWVEGELIRTDVTEGQAGVALHLDLQFLDINTCAAVTEGTLIDIWATNSTGVYSGVSATGQGGLNTTHNRGIQATDSDGVVQFDTIVPGHYTGRTPHIHLLATYGATVLENSTYLAASGTPTHIGQIFFDQDLITEVETTEPYTSNTQSLTTNAEDMINIQEATVDYDPFLDYVRLGDSITDGLLGFITVFVDSSANVTSSRQAAAHYYAGGGVSESRGGGGGGPGGPPPS